LTGFDPSGHSPAAAAFDYPAADSLRPEVSARTSPARRFSSIDAFERALMGMA
jgi:hypothetical protein